MAERIVDPWHFSHLEKDYFTVILRGAKGAGFWPIEFVYTGKSGKVPYSQKAVGRLNNPKWMIENAAGETRTGEGGMRKSHAYNRANLIKWTYAEIVAFFKLDM